MATPLHFVLFGMPGAGKSSLLGAFVQAAQTQEQLLTGKIVNPPSGLLELQRRLYENQARETVEEVVPYPIALEPTSSTKATNNLPRRAILYDCNGHVANELLSRRQSMGEGRDGALAKAILNADALALVVDASAEPGTLRRDFGQFSQFLQHLQQQRGDRVEIGGLPVYLVLTKCDLLAGPNDSFSTWIDRVEERKNEVRQQFEDFLADESERKNMAFGRLDLHVWATAVKRPALAGQPAKPREPFGVAELLRQGLTSAAQYQVQRGAAAQRLTFTVLGILTVVAAVALLILGLFLGQQSAQSRALTDEARRLQRLSSDLFNDPVEDRLGQLQKIKDDPQFANLPEDLQKFVTRASQELIAYQAYAKQLEKAKSGLANLSFVRSDETLKNVKERLEALTPPPQYADWHKLVAIQERAHWLKEIDALNNEAKRVRKEYEAVLDKARKLDQNPPPAAERKARAQEVLDKARRLPDPVSYGNRTIPNSEDITYTTLFSLPSVDDAYHRWRTSPFRETLEAWSKRPTDS